MPSIYRFGKRFSILIVFRFDDHLREVSEMKPLMRPWKNNLLSFNTKRKDMIYPAKKKSTENLKKKMQKKKPEGI